MISERFLRTDCLKEKLGLICISYWLTIIFSRTLGLYYLKEYSINPAFVIKGMVIPYYLIGSFFILVSLAAYFLANLKNNLFPLLVGGIGLGLIFDEFNSWTNFRGGNYWTSDNFFAVLIFGSFLSLLFIFSEKKSSDFSQSAACHVNPRNPFVSLVIPAFNEERFLGKTLQSVLSQDYKNFELIVVDNNSSDRTSEIAKGFGAKVIFEPRQGTGSARQKGFSEAKGEIIATTDADTILSTDWLSRIVEKFEKDKDLVGFGGLYTLLSGPILARIAVFYLAHFGWSIMRVLCGSWSLPGANLAVKKEAFLRIGGFNLELDCYEDADLSSRLAKIGKAVLDPDFLVKTSGRRFKDGFFSGFAIYLFNAIIKAILRGKKFLKLPNIRVEAPPLSKLSFLPIFISVIFLFFLFDLSNPLISQAKEAKKEARILKEKIVRVENRIKENGRELKKSLNKNLNSIKNNNIKSWPKSNF